MAQECIWVTDPMGGNPRLVYVTPVTGGLVETSSGKPVVPLYPK